MPDGAHMAAPEPPKLSPAEQAAFLKRRRARNIALFVVLLALAVLFYAMTIAKLSKGMS